MLNVKHIDTIGRVRDYPECMDRLLQQVPELERRDSRVIDENQGFKISVLAGRRKFILLKFDYLRGMLFPDHLLLFVSNNTQFRTKILAFVEELTEVLKPDVGSDSQSKPFRDRKPFMLTVLEEFLKHVHGYYMSEMEALRPDVKRINDAMVEDDDRWTKRESDIKTRLFRIERKHVQLHFKVKDIHELLHEHSYEKDEEKIDDLVIIQEPSDTATELLELIDSYASYFEELAEELDQIDELIGMMIKLVNINISQIRNKYARIAIYLHLVSIGISCANLISSSFGMNLDNHLDYRHSFLTTNLIMLLLSVSVAIGGSLFFKFKLLL